MDELEDLKNNEVRPQFLAMFDTRLVMKAITAWPDCFVVMEDFVQEPEETNFKWLWRRCVFNLDKFTLMVGPRASELLLKLASAYAIYPDGTYQEDYLQFILNLSRQEKKNGK